MIATKPGWIGRTEIVEVTYDPKRVTLEQLVKKGESCQIARKLFCRTDEQLGAAVKLVGKRAVKSTETIRVQDDKYYLSRTPLKFVPMDSMQAMVVNARVGKRLSLDGFLSPRQKELLAQVKAKPKAGWKVVIGKSVVEGWATQQAVLGK